MKKKYDVEQNKEEYLMTLCIDGVCIFLCWKAEMPGSRWTFQGVEVNAFNLKILQHTHLMDLIASLPEEITPVACVQVVRRWGFVREEC